MSVRCCWWHGRLSLLNHFFTCHYALEYIFLLQNFSRKKRQPWKDDKRRHVDALKANVQALNRWRWIATSRKNTKRRHATWKKHADNIENAADHFPRKSGWPRFPAVIHLSKPVYVSILTPFWVFLRTNVGIWFGSDAVATATNECNTISFCAIRIDTSGHCNHMSNNWRNSKLRCWWFSRGKKALDTTARWNKSNMDISPLPNLCPFHALLRFLRHTIVCLIMLYRKIARSTVFTTKSYYSFLMRKHQRIHCRTPSSWFHAVSLLETGLQGLRLPNEIRSLLRENQLINISL